MLKFVHVAVAAALVSSMFATGCSGVDERSPLPEKAEAQSTGRPPAAEDARAMHPDAKDLSAVVGGDEINSVESVEFLERRIVLYHGSMSDGGEPPAGINRSFSLVVVKLADGCWFGDDVSGIVGDGTVELHMLVEDGMAVAVWTERVRGDDSGKGFADA